MTFMFLVVIGGDFVVIMRMLILKSFGGLAFANMILITNGQRESLPIRRCGGAAEARLRVELVPADRVEAPRHLAL